MDKQAHKNTCGEGETPTLSGKCTQRGAQKLGPAGHLESQGVTDEESGRIDETPVNIDQSHDLARTVKNRFWWARGDLNPQALRHKILSLACLPISPLAQLITCQCRRYTSGTARSRGAPASVSDLEHDQDVLTVIVLGDGAEAIEEAVGDGARWGVKASYGFLREALWPDGRRAFAAATIHALKVPGAVPHSPSTTTKFYEGFDDRPTGPLSTTAGWKQEPKSRGGGVGRAAVHPSRSLHRLRR